MAKFIGVDGCKGGWVYVAWDSERPDQASIGVVEAFASLPLSGVATLAVDIPIGFADVAAPGGREPDRLARRFLGKKGSSVFSTPCRAALGAEDFATANVLNRENSGDKKIGLSRQSTALIPKMKEVDDFMTLERQDFILEAHPEVSFAIMNGMRPVISKKRKRDGREARQRLLEAVGFPVRSLPDLPSSSVQARRDDILDACACCWTAIRIHKRAAMLFPEQPAVDARNLRMQISA